MIFFQFFRSISWLAVSIEMSIHSLIDNATPGIADKDKKITWMSKWKKTNYRAWVDFGSQIQYWHENYNSGCHNWNQSLVHWSFMIRAFDEMLSYACLPVSEILKLCILINVRSRNSIMMSLFVMDEIHIKYQQIHEPLVKPRQNLIKHHQKVLKMVLGTNLSSRNMILKPSYQIDNALKIKR